MTRVILLFHPAKSLLLTAKINALFSSESHGSIKEVSFGIFQFSPMKFQEVSRESATTSVSMVHHDISQNQSVDPAGTFTHFLIRKTFHALSWNLVSGLRAISSDVRLVMVMFHLATPQSSTFIFVAE